MGGKQWQKHKGNALVETRECKAPRLSAFIMQNRTDKHLPDNLQFVYN